jgi:pimeloyl-ACP methyl ester carboxylesterase
MRPTQWALNTRIVALGNLTIVAAVLGLLVGNQARGALLPTENLSLYLMESGIGIVLRGVRTAPRLVILHGGPGGNAYVFEHTVGARLEQYATLIYYDQRGGGRSAAPTDPSAYGMDTLVADLEALRTQLSAAKISLLGFSFGAELALEYAVAHSDRVERLVLQAPNAGDYRRMAITDVCDAQYGPGARCRRHRQVAPSPN